MGKPILEIIVLFQNLGDKQTYFARSPAPPLSQPKEAFVSGDPPPGPTDFESFATEG